MINRYQQSQNIGIDPNHFYYVPTPPYTGEPYTIPSIPVYPPIYPVPQDIPNVCPGCGRCRTCGQPAPPIITITRGNYS